VQSAASNEENSDSSISSSGSEYDEPEEIKTENIPEPAIRPEIIEEVKVQPEPEVVIL
jgi:hypothetical protein